MKFPLSRETQRIRSLASGHVVPEPERCIQCGICSFNCPIGIDVRLHRGSEIMLKIPTA